MIYHIAMILTLIGALNWGLVGVTSVLGNRFDLVEWLSLDLLNIPIIGDVIYIVVGVSAVVVLVMMKNR